jgi:multidrug resistance efflux pump
MTNPITEEIRAIRHQQAAHYNNDLDLIVADLQRQQHLSDRVIIDRSQLSKHRTDHKQLSKNNP